MNQSSSICRSMEELSSSAILKFFLLLTISICSILVPMVLLASHWLWFSKTASLFHKNLRIIIQFHLLGFLIHGVSRVILHSIDLFNYLLLDNPCDMVPNLWRCFWLRFYYGVGLWITSTTVIPLVFERWAATKFSSRYEKTGMIAGFVFVFVQCVFCAIHLQILYSGSVIEGVTMPYCMVARDSKVNVGEINGWLTIAVQLVARTAFQFLYTANKRLRKAQLESSLSNRYQLEQNLLIMDILKMFANISAVYLFLHAWTFIGVLKLKDIVTMPVYFALVELNSSYPVYGILSIILMIRLLQTNRRKVHANLSVHVHSKWEGDEKNFGTLLSML